MPLHPGTTLGSYAVTAKIGEGGMGEVYQARDTKLDRDVALKVLPQACTDDPDRLARFERGAKVFASLNHLNIGDIYGLEEAEGQKALVLELVEGPTLADRIKQGPILVDEALPIGSSAQCAGHALNLTTPLNRFRVIAPWLLHQASHTGGGVQGKGVGSATIFKRPLIHPRTDQ